MRDQFLAPAVLPQDKRDSYSWEDGRLPQLICGSSNFDVTAETGDRGQSTRDNRTHANSAIPCLHSKPRLTQQADWNSRISLDVSELRLRLWWPKFVVFLRASTAMQVRPPSLHARIFSSSFAAIVPLALWHNWNAESVIKGSTTK